MFKFIIPAFVALSTLSAIFVLNFRYLIWLNGKRTSIDTVHCKLFISTTDHNLQNYILVINSIKQPGILLN